MKAKVIRCAPQVSGYGETGASFSKRALKNFTPNSSSPNEDINKSNSVLRRRSRLLYMSSPIATAAIKTNRTKVVGVGLGLKSSINHDFLKMTPEAAKAWQRHTEAEFKLWASQKRNCDATGINDFASLQQLALSSQLMSGDVFALIKRVEPTKQNPYSLRIHLIEADRICTPTEYRQGALYSINSVEGVVPDDKPGAGNRIYDGVEIDKNGAIVAYYICDQYPNELRMKNLKWTRVTAYGEQTGLPNILHISSSERPEQYRGVPYLAQVIEPLLQFRRYTESELMRALVQSFYTAWITTNSDDGAVNPLVNEATPEGGAELSEDSNDYEMGPGTINFLSDGEDIKFGNPNVPTAGFEVFVKTYCKLIGAALELPYDVLIKEFNSSYSAARGALLEAYEAFKMRRVWFVNDFCKPIYEIWLAEAVALGRIKAPGFFDDPLIRSNWCNAEWIGPVQPSLDPIKEAKAAEKRIELGVDTRERVARENGTDWEENAVQLKREAQALAEIHAIAQPAK